MLSSFVGRESELSELATLLPQARLLTITGVGGAGKTRLALELAARVEKLFVDGARVVELASVRDDRPLAHDVLSSLGIESGPSSGLAAMEQLCQVLAPRQMLLVLDNCEHVLEPAAVLAEGVLRRCPRVTMLATSRETLSLAGEVAWVAPGLSLPPPNTASPDDLEGSDAAALFIVRGRAAQPGFGATPGNAGAIARICRRLDGIPLALELAAARVRVLSAAQLADRLDDRLRLLTSGPRSAPARHQTLRAAMDWSFELLTDPEQELLRRLSVFPHSFDLEAATAVAGDDADPIDVLDRLARLVDKSLLGAEGAAETIRYRLLETVREYAREKMVGAGEESEARSRHRRHFVERIMSAYRSGMTFFGIEWARQLTRDSENYNFALATAVDDGDLEAATVLIAGRGYSWFWGTPVPTVLDSVDPETLTCAEVSLLVQGLLSLAGAGVITGRWSLGAGDAVYERALAIADESGTPEDQGFARYFLGYLARSRGDSVTARSWTEGALRCLGESPTVGRFYAQYELGWIELTEGNAAAARHRFHSTLTSLLEASSDYDIQVLHLRAGLALAETIEGHVADGLRLAHQAVEEARTTALPGVLVMALVRAAEVAAVAGKPTGPELPEVLRLLRDQGTLRWVGSALNMAAVAHEHRPEVAARLLGGATSVAHVLGEDPLPLPALASVVSACRRRLESVLGPAPLADAETAGEHLPVARLLDLALDGLET
jgi:non-specific serine/threonine protein kinase